MRTDSLKDAARSASTKSTLIFDGDDTLWYDIAHYEDACRRFQDFMKEQGFDPSRSEKMRQEIDSRNMMRFGFSSKRFPESMAETYEFLCSEKGIKPVLNAKQRIVEIGTAVFTECRSVLPGAMETLEILKKRGHVLVLMTVGEKDVQEKKVKDTCVGGLFNAKYIVERKTLDAYLVLISELSLDAGETFMIGNSLRSDVLPALQAGLNVIHIPNETWAYEKGDESQLENFKGKYHKVSCISEVPFMIEKLESRNAQAKARVKK